MITKLIIKGIVPGLNGKDGLIREHWRKATRRKDLYYALLKSQTNNKHTGKVIIRYIGYKLALMDWDNFTASFKHLGDALVKAKIIKDDKPSIVVQFLPDQIKVNKRIEQRIEIIIEDIEKN